MVVPAFGQAKKSTPLPKTTFAPKAASQARPEKVLDPVYGLMVEKDPQLSAMYKGQTYYFCSKADRDKFTKNPGKSGHGSAVIRNAAPPSDPLSSRAGSVCNRRGEERHSGRVRSRQKSPDR